MQINRDGIDKGLLAVEYIDRMVTNLQKSQMNYQLKSATEILHCVKKHEAWGGGQEIQQILHNKQIREKLSNGKTLWLKQGEGTVHVCSSSCCTAGSATKSFGAKHEK